MTFTADFQVITDTVLAQDPSFRAVPASALDRCLKATQRAAGAGDKHAFLLSAMRLLALAGNGHTRLIPNDAIKVLPLRLVTLGSQVWRAEDGRFTARLVALNGRPIADIWAAGLPYLAGPPQRQRVIGSILLVWPEALAHLGFADPAAPITYSFQTADGTTTDLHMNPTDRVPAATLYPIGEHGRADPSPTPARFLDIADRGRHGRTLTLPSFFDPGNLGLAEAIDQAAQQVTAQPDTPILLDLRGNTGGNFRTTLPLIDALAQGDPTRPVAALVDKFTFSAAIVFVALLRDRLGAALQVVGEEMGDRLTFYAEGGTTPLGTSGAAIRYSTAFHDWAGGTADPTTPPEIRKHLVAVGALAIDRPLSMVALATGETSTDAVLDRLAAP